MLKGCGITAFGCGIVGWLFSGRDPTWLFVIGTGPCMYAMILFQVLGSDRILATAAGVPAARRAWRNAA